MAATQEFDERMPQNRDDLAAAGVPENYMALVARATDAFWAECAKQFPEMTSGDTQLCDEPGNAIALWLCQGTGHALLEDQLVVAEQSLNAYWVDRVRMVQVLANCIKAARESVATDLPELEPPSVKVMGYLFNVIDEVLYWNFQRPPEDEEGDTEDDGTPGEGEEAEARN